MNANSNPDGYRTITPYLKLPGAGRLLEFLTDAFDGVERGKLTKPDGTVLHAEVQIGDSLVMVHEAPPHWPVRPSTLYLYVADADAIYQRALAAGGESLAAPTDMYYGDRVACVRDVSGNDWWIATRLESASMAEIQQRATEFLSARAGAANQH